ncbi:MAG: hypothetical protein ACD_48C00422G0001 [uncultured bacterium]|nr:MAG: hypothetical protein ACD_48C00422G0001 [uncultured bacterium]
MKTKKLAAVVVGLSLSVIVGLFVSVDFIQASVTQSDDTSVPASVFTDEIPTWASDSIYRLNAAGVIKGYDDGRFGPSDNLTRGQVVTLLYRTLKYKNIINDPDPEACSYYGDVKDTDYYYVPVCIVSLNSESAVFDNDPDTFSPDALVTRAEVARLTDLILGGTFLGSMNKDREEGVVFEDVPKGSEYFDNIALAYTTGLMSGKSEGHFDPDGLLNRAEMSVIMDRTLNLLESLKIKELAKDVGKTENMTKCSDLITRQMDACSAHENWSLSIQVLKQDMKTNKSEVEINEVRFGPGNRCSSEEAGDIFPADVQSEFWSNMESGGGEETQELCQVSCIGWDACSESEEMVNQCTGDSMTASDCLSTCDGTCEASPDQANCSVCVPCEPDEYDGSSDYVNPSNNCGEEPFYDCSQCNGLPSYPTFAYEDCLTACQNAFYNAQAAYNACLDQAGY